jgi:hypothetical protein
MLVKSFLETESYAGLVSFSRVEALRMKACIYSVDIV